MTDYPTREPYYAHRLTRLLFKSCAAQSIGQDAVLLVIHIAHTEDAARYQGPVRFWNSQLNEVLGFRSPKSLNTARRRAVESGWLMYQRKNDRADGLYFTTIPRSVMAFDDEPIEPITPIPSTESVPSTEQEAERESYALRNRKVTGNDPLPNPVPNPKEKRPRFEKPDLEDVRQYATERNSGINPEQFYDHYEANGWTQGRNKPIRDWQAAFRTWERNGFGNHKTSDSPNDDEYPNATAERLKKLKAGGT